MHTIHLYIRIAINNSNVFIINMIRKGGDKQQKKIKINKGEVGERNLPQGNGHLRI